MATTVFPVAVASSSGSVSAYTIPAAAASTLYSSAFAVAKGVYTITTSPSNSVAVIDFWSGNTYIGTTRTVSGTVTYNLGTAADLIYVTVNTADTNVTLTLVANAAIVSGVSGTLDTLTTSQTYTQTGKAYVVVVGGGGGGMGNQFGNFGSGCGGGGGGLLASPVTLSGSTSVVIGARGNAGTGGNPTPNVAANAGGATTFGTLTANGGSGGNYASGNQSTGTSGGTPSGYITDTSATATGSQNIGGQNSNPANFVVSGNNGGGGGYGGAGRGNGIGTGGGGAGSAGTGYGAGGGGVGSNSNAATTGGVGTAGVVYVLRGLV
jgi:hypothetical protein